MSDSPQMIECENCGDSIGQLETPFVWNDRVVCGKCHARLRPAEVPPPLPQAIPYARPTRLDDADLYGSESPASPLPYDSRTTREAPSSGLGSSVVKGLAGVAVAIAIIFALAYAVTPSNTPRPRASGVGNAPVRSPPGSAAMTPATDVAVGELVTTYAANEVAADQRWKGRRLRLIAPVKQVGRDIRNKPYLIFEGERFREVQCFFEPAREGELVNLRVGQEIVLEGTCDGKFMNVLLRDCRVVSVAGAPPKW